MELLPCHPRLCDCFPFQRVHDWLRRELDLDNEETSVQVEILERGGINHGSLFLEHGTQ
jgi:hypothetical protein